MQQTQTPNTRINKNNKKLEESTSEILGEITTRLKESNDELKEIASNPDSLIDEETYKKFERHVGQNVQLPINRISLSDNVRNSIDTEADEFQKLRADIARNGIQQNVIVELIPLDKGGKLVCVAGHRRITAALLLGNITHIPALIKQYKNRGDRTQSALAENLLRKDLHCLDIADGYQRMLEEGWEKDDLVEIFDRNEKTIRYYLKIAKWPKEVKEFIRSNSEKFSTRLLLNKFASRRFPSNMALLQALEQTIKSEPLKTTHKKSTTKISLKNQLEEIRCV